MTIGMATPTVEELEAEIERLCDALDRIIAYADTCLDDGSVHIAADIARKARQVTTNG